MEFLFPSFLNLFEGPSGMLPETHPLDVLVSVDGVFSGHYFSDGRMACSYHPSLQEPFCQVEVGKLVFVF